MSTPAQRSVRQRYLSQRRLRGVSVVYSRGDESVPLTLTPARTATMVEDSQTNTRIRSFTRDYLILPEELVIGGEQIWPRAGDEMAEADGAVYEAVAELHGEPTWRWDDQQTKQIIRVHTQLIVGT